MALIGYARISTGEQSLDPQRLALVAAGCDAIREEQASGASRARPVLGRLLAGIGKGDTLVVVRLDRLARSLTHLLQIIERLEAKGAYFRSLGDPVDTASAQGRFTLQVLGAAAELERALIRERTRAGLAAARAEGRIGGNPGLRRGDPDARRKLSQARQDAYAHRLAESAGEWVPLVRRHRPEMPWHDLTRLVNARRPAGSPIWSPERLRRAAGHYVRDGLLCADILTPAPRRPGDDRLLAIIAGIRAADPGMTLQAICARLEKMREPTPRGQSRWYPSTVQMLLMRAKNRGLMAD